MLIYQCENCQHEILPREGEGMLEWGCEHCGVMYRLNQEEVDDWYLQQDLPGSTFYTPPNEATEPVEWPDGSWHNSYYWWTYREPRPPYEHQIGYGRRWAYVDPDIMMAVRDPSGLTNGPLSFRQTLRLRILEIAKRIMPTMSDEDLMRFTLLLNREMPQLRPYPGNIPEGWHVDREPGGRVIGGVRYQEPEDGGLNLADIDNPEEGRIRGMTITAYDRRLSEHEIEAITMHNQRHEQMEQMMRPVNLENFEFEWRRRNEEYQDAEAIDYGYDQTLDELLETETPKEPFGPPAHWR